MPNQAQPDHFSGVEYVAEVMEKNEAQDEFGRAKEKGQGAGIVATGRDVDMVS